MRSTRAAGNLTELSSAIENLSLGLSAVIRLLILDDAASASLVSDALRAGGLSFELKQVETEAEFIRELDEFSPHIILAGSTLPSFGEHIALESARRTHPEIPVIMMSDRAAAEKTLEFVRAGRRHLIFKDDLPQIVPAVQAALKWKDELGESMQTTEQLRASETRYRRLFEAAKDGILILDAGTGRILDSNPFMTELLGYSSEELLGRRLWEIGAFADQIASRSAFGKLRKNRYIRYHDMPLKTKAGRLIDVEFISNVYREGDHDTIQCNIRNNTASNLIEKRLSEVQKMAALGVLTGGIAHNVNNLLTVIIGNIELLRERTAQDELSASYTKGAIEAALRGSELIRHMLAFARQQPLRPQAIDIGGLVSALATSLRGLLGENVEISLSLPDEKVWPVLSDAAQLEACILNLAVNARDAMPNGGKLVITTRNRHLGPDTDLVCHTKVDGEYVEVAVSDSGSGIPADKLQRIFEPFYTTKGSAPKPGTGLGLSTVFGFVKQSGGYIAVESEVEVGTTFRIYLPRHEEITPVAEAPVPATPTHASGGRETILVVDDDAAVRMIVIFQLELLGYKVLEADNSAAALAVLNKQHVDLLFTDVVMRGETDGLVLAEAARSRWPRMKIILTTGFGDSMNQRAAIGLRVLAKPYRSVELARALREAFDGDGVSLKRASGG